MKAAPRHGFAWLAGTAIALLALSACDGTPATNGTVTVPGNLAEAPANTATPAPPPANVSADIVVRETLRPAPAASNRPIPNMQVHKDFTDPPLPPELQDDGGLKPLPPRPGATPTR